MMRTSNLLRWAHTTKNGSNKNTSKNWIHTPESLLHGHIAYLVKFLGSTDVEQPKGIDVVKEGIRKLRFSHQLRKAEGQRTPKVELTVSVDGVAIQEPKAKRILHQYPLHRISYCADDKAEKKFFSFIAKEANSEKHTCYVFVSDKLAEEITLTIGQAFDLAYRRFLETTGRETEGRRQMNQLQQNIESLEYQNQVFRRRLQQLSSLVEASKLAEFLASQGISEVLDVTRESETEGIKDISNPNFENHRITDNALINLNANNEDSLRTISRTEMNLLNLPPIPPRSFEGKSENESIITPQSIEGLLLESDDDFDPRSDNSSIKNNNAKNETFDQISLLQSNNSDINKGKDVFGAEPFGINTDPFGMDDFGHVVASQTDQELNSCLSDHRLTEMREGFSRGLSFGGEDFKIDPLLLP